MIPDYVGAITVTEINGHIEAIEFYTMGGIQSQDEVLDDLIRKFGRPADQSVRQMQNAFGAKYDVAVALWRIPQFGGIVRFSGADQSGRANFGWMQILSDKALALSAKQAVRPSL